MTDQIDYNYNNIVRFLKRSIEFMKILNGHVLPETVGIASELCIHLKIIIPLLQACNNALETQIRLTEPNYQKNNTDMLGVSMQHKMEQLMASIKDRHKMNSNDLISFHMLQFILLEELEQTKSSLNQCLRSLANPVLFKLHME